MYGPQIHSTNVSDEIHHVHSAATGAQPLSNRQSLRSLRSPIQRESQLVRSCRFYRLDDEDRWYRS